MAGTTQSELSRLSGARQPSISQTLCRNLTRLRGNGQGEPHERNVRRWSSLVSAGDV